MSDRKSTPYFLINKEQVIANYKSLKKNLHLCRLFYSLKANSDVQVIKTLNEFGSSFDTSSIEEFNYLIGIGIHPENIIISLPIKDKRILQSLYHRGCRYFVFDSKHGLEMLIKYAPYSTKILRIDISDIDLTGIFYGLQDNELDASIVDNIQGITFHIRKNFNISTVIRCLEKCERVLSAYNLSNLILNIGGDYRQIHEVGKDFYPLLNQALKELADKYRLTLYAEPGHGIMKTAGSLFTQVLDVKATRERTYVYIDSAEQHGVTFPPPKISVVNRSPLSLSETIIYSFIGMTCNHDILFDFESNFSLLQGDILEFHDYVSYTISRSTRFHRWRYPDVYIE